MPQLGFTPFSLESALILRLVSLIPIWDALQPSLCLSRYPIDLDTGLRTWLSSSTLSIPHHQWLPWKSGLFAEPGNHPQVCPVWFGACTRHPSHLSLHSSSPCCSQAQGTVKTHQGVCFLCLLRGFGCCDRTVAAMIAPDRNQNQTSFNIVTAALPTSCPTHWLEKKKNLTKKQAACYNGTSFLCVEIQWGDDISFFTLLRQHPALNWLKANN